MMNEVKKRDLPLTHIPFGILKGTPLYTKTVGEKIFSLVSIHHQKQIRITITNCKGYVWRYDVRQHGTDDHGPCTTFSIGGNRRTPHGALTAALEALQQGYRENLLVAYSNTATSGHDGQKNNQSASLA